MYFYVFFNLQAPSFLFPKMLLLHSIFQTFKIFLVPANAWRLLIHFKNLGLNIYLEY